MADTRTAITCPLHPECVAVIVARPEDKLNGEKRIKPAMWLDFWVDRHPGKAIVEINHEPASVDPDVFLTAAANDERDHASLRRLIKQLEDRVIDLERSYVQVNANLSVESKRNDRIETFVTRRKRWRKEWDRV